MTEDKIQQGLKIHQLTSDQAAAAFDEYVLAGGAFDFVTFRFDAANFDWRFGADGRRIRKEPA